MDNIGSKNPCSEDKNKSKGRKIKLIVKNARGVI